MIPRPAAHPRHCHPGGATPRLIGPQAMLGGACRSAGDPPARPGASVPPRPARRIAPWGRCVRTQPILRWSGRHRPPAALPAAPPRSPRLSARHLSSLPTRRARPRWVKLLGGSLPAVGWAARRMGRGRSPMPIKGKPIGPSMGIASLCPSYDDPSPTPRLRFRDPMGRSFSVGGGRAVARHMHRPRRPIRHRVERWLGQGGAEMPSGEGVMPFLGGWLRVLCGSS